MDIKPLSTGTSRRESPPLPPAGENGQPPQDTFEKSDPAASTGPQGRRFTSQEVGKALLSPDKKELEEKIVNARVIWDFEKKDSTACDTVFDKERKTLYTGVGTRDQWYLTAFNPDGTVKWAFLDEPAKSSPVLDGEGNAYIRTAGNLCALDKDGKKLWSYPTSGFSSWDDTPPAIGPDGTVYIIRGNPEGMGTSSQNLRFQAVKDGNLLWHYDAIGDPTGDPRAMVGRDGTVYLSASKAQKKPGGWFSSGEIKEKDFLIALKPDGREKFRVPVESWPSYTHGNIAEGPDGSIYACHGERNLSCYTPGGKLKWTYTLNEKVTGANGHARLTQVPAFDEEGSLYLASDTSAAYPEGYLVKLDGNGKELWSKTIKGGFASKPHMGPDGKLYVSAHTGELCLFDKDGGDKGTLRAGEISSNNFSFGEEGVVYLNNYDRIIAFQPDIGKMPGDGESSPESPEPQAPKVLEEEDFVIIGGVKLPKGK
ncbi:MAG: PQQ-binding-like beta-propeller repeat protein [Candidatus Eremiobacteraeota bacterium]|nr:PQQ-binding-like beta-propeller repeat protein [Candidatus Eremiobacteraeota bacterium]